MFQLNEKVVVLVGGSGLLGLEFSKAILKQGGRLYSIDLKEKEGVEKLKKDKNFTFRILNAQDKSNLEKLRNEIVSKEDHIDVLINSTTSKGEDAYLPFEELTKKGWDSVIEGNLTIPLMTCQVFIEQMKKQGHGSIINISSIYGIVGNDQRIYEDSNLAEVYLNRKDIKQIFSHPSYNAAKGGLIAFTKFLASYYGKDNIRVNSISPGGINNGKENKSFLKKYSEKVPLARKARPDEISGSVVFLASDESSYITGHNLVVDGGYTAW